MVGIKGWKMPETCADCFFKGYHADDYNSYSWCKCLGNSSRLDIRPDVYEAFHGKRLDFCPLVEVPDWHDVNDLPPLFDKEVLIYDDDIGVALGWLASNGKWQTDEINELDAVTHWQYVMLPKKIIFKNLLTNATICAILRT